MALQGMGVSTFWGFTPAIDLQNAPPAARSAGKWKAAGGGGGAPLRVLDVRIIKLEFSSWMTQLELTAPALQKAINHCSSLQCSSTQLQSRELVDISCTYIVCTCTPPPPRRR